ncbi:uncharacterized protein BO88DRAFT_455634 [Aspergillus vadensis CBS 113365]|uniref:Uncharacterized protein n=1 Tax=Aspergillus vadensis (strain CBS 113365 / IMI 142717 / IBT 24658) TaxID=1448311 RepID=A0A319B9R3_ASPVC|nr:hypothetical protein BO88DRAFT_455634 [Aspergillus vadensis CBS 113365]PYH67200.1 hypothetical protein BO88DRAFT_455634 [Aspergillus vadensis CBS 113365]
MNTGDPWPITELRAPVIESLAMAAVDLVGTPNPLPAGFRANYLTTRGPATGAMRSLI